LLAFAVLCLALLPAGGEEFVKKPFITPGDPKLIYLNADSICTWTEGPLRVFLLRGTAWIEQGLIKISMPESVVWVDEARKKGSSVYYLTVYGEGEVVLRYQASRRTAGRVLLPNDPVYVRGRTEKQVAQAPAASAPTGTGVVPASETVPQSPAANPRSARLPTDSAPTGGIGEPPPLQRADWQRSLPGAGVPDGVGVLPPPSPAAPPALVPELVSPPPLLSTTANKTQATPPPTALVAPVTPGPPPAAAPPAGPPPPAINPGVAPTPGTLPALPAPPQGQGSVPGPPTPRALPGLM